jgi:hypothetical protein
MKQKHRGVVFIKHSYLLYLSDMIWIIIILFNLAQVLYYSGIDTEMWLIGQSLLCKEKRVIKRRSVVNEKMKYRKYWGLAAFLAATAIAVPALAEEASVGDTVIHLAYSIDTFYFLMSGALVMWMAAGFTMLEAGLVRGKNTVEILTKNVALYSIACIMYMIVGYNIMYGGGPNGVIPGLSFFLGADHTVDEVLKSGGETYYSSMSDFFFQVVFV